MAASPMLIDDKLSYEIFSILENKFLFGYDCPNLNQPKPVKQVDNSNGKVRILSVDGSGSTAGILAATALVHLESSLQRISGNPDARIADYFDIVAGTNTGGILAACLFTRGKNGGPMFTAEKALKFLLKFKKLSKNGIFRRFFRSPESDKLLRKAFGDSTLKDTLKSVLVPCYDMSSRAPFLFSRADAVEFDGFDFKMRDVCLATTADRTVEMVSVDKKTRIVAVDGEIAMNNPTAAAITHVLNNKQEFPFCNGVEDLIVVSLGNGEFDFDAGKSTISRSMSVRIAGDGAADMVDQAVSMAFGQCRTNNYVRIQANSITSSDKKRDILAMATEMLGWQNVESVLFEGKKMVESTNMKKLEEFGEELIKERERRKTRILPTVILKQNSPSRTSSATTLSTTSSC